MKIVNRIEWCNFVTDMWLTGHHANMANIWRKLGYNYTEWQCLADCLN